MFTVVLAGLVLGLVSNLHCLGMCGPLALMIPINRKNNVTVLVDILKYNIGRIVSYIFLGSIIGSISSIFNLINLLQILSIIAGISLILIAWRSKLSKLLHINTLSPKILNVFQRFMGWASKSKSPFKLFFLGGINGLLPCGMVYMALINALVIGSVSGGMMAMLAFGIGTLPIMIAVPFLANRTSIFNHKRIKIIIPYIITLVGALIIVRGMNLDIPLISPKVSQTNSTPVKSDSTNSPSQESIPKCDVEMSCCHSN